MSAGDLRSLALRSAEVLELRLKSTGVLLIRLLCVHVCLPLWLYTPFMCSESTPNGLSGIILMCVAFG